MKNNTDAFSKKSLKQFINCKELTAEMNHTYLDQRIG